MIKAYRYVNKTTLADGSILNLFERYTDVDCAEYEGLVAFIYRNSEDDVKISVGRDDDIMYTGLPEVK